MPETEEEKTLVWESIAQICSIRILCVAETGIKKMGVLKVCLQSMELVKIEWNLMVEVRLLPLFDECPTPSHRIVMNIIAWNCRGALKPKFQNHNPAMLIVMETRVGGDRAKEITNRLPFDEAIHTETIGYAGGLWLLWNSDRVAVSLLATTKQEIHVSVKVRPSDTQCLLSAVYASPSFNKKMYFME